MTEFIDYCFHCEKHTKFNNQWCQECGKSSNEPSVEFPDDIDPEYEAMRADLIPESPK